MAELNEQDPITGRKLPRLANYTGQDQIDPTKPALPRIRRNTYVPGVQLVDYTRSGYDNPETYVEDLPRLGAIRAENQGFGSTLMNGLGRAAVNIIPTVVGNVASMLDFEDYANQDNEVGNAITRAMEEFKTSVDESMPIYRENQGKSFDIGDSAWWIDNGSSLVESIAAFAITGAGLGAAFNIAGKGLGTINALANLGEAGKVAATVLSATGLNQAESITTAMQVYDTTYRTAIENGQDDARAKQNAADAAAYSININRANIALNLTSAGAFIRNPNLTRQIRHAFTGQGARQMLHEGVQEYAEETLNYVAQKEGERMGDSVAKGKQYQFDFNKAVSDAFSAQGIESGVLGFIGGAGQVGLTRALNRMNGRAAQQDAAYQSQQESIARIQGLQDAGIVPNVTNIFNNTSTNIELQNQIQQAADEGNDAKVKELQYQLFNTQLNDALDNGTVDQLESVYTDLLNLTSEEAANKGLDVEPTSPYYYKKKANEALELIADVEESYLKIANKGYVNPNEVMQSYIQGKTLNRLLTEQMSDYNKSHTEALQDKLNLGIQADLNSTNPPAELTNLDSYKRYLIDRTLVENTRNRLIKNNEEYNNLISNDTQNKLKEEARAKLQEGLEKARKAAKEQEDADVKKRQKEIKEKVDKVNNEVTEEVVTPEETDVDTFEDVPLPTEENVPIEQSEVDTFIDEVEDQIEPEVESEIPVVWFPFDSEEVDENTITPEEQATADIVVQEEINNTEKEIKNDGLVRTNTDLTKTSNYVDTTRQRTVGNTIISLNVDYVETVLGNVDDKTNERRILDTFDDEGLLIINENFDSRLQSPNQFKPGDDVRIVVPTFDQMRESGVTGYTESDYNIADTDIDSFVIAFIDANNKIIGYLPTRSNINKRVDPAYREAALINNRKLRETLYNNRDKEYTVKITRKSVGSLLTNKVNRDLYNALGDGTRLADDVELAIFKDSRLQTSISTNSNKSIINKPDLNSGFLYAVIPTAETGSYLATPMNINTIGEEGAESVLRMIQLYKASDRLARDKALVNERNELAREIDFANTTDFNNAVSSVMYTSTTDDAYMFKMGKNKLSLGVTSDMNFAWDDVMSDQATQTRIKEILAKRYHAVQLSNFGQRFNYYALDADNKLAQERYNNYFDFLDQRGVISTNVQGYPVANTNNERYFTGQSVIEFSNPIITGTNDNIQEAEEVTPDQIEAPVEDQGEPGEAAVPKKKSTNKLGIKYKPKNTPSVTEDINSVIEISNIKGIDTQAEALMKKCQG